MSNRESTSVSKSEKADPRSSSLFGSRGGTQIRDRLKRERERTRNIEIFDVDSDVDSDADSDMDIITGSIETVRSTEHSESDAIISDDSSFVSDEFVEYYRSELDDIDTNDNAVNSGTSGESRSDYFTEYANQNMVGGEVRMSKDEEAKTKIKYSRRPSRSRFDEREDEQAELDNRMRPMAIEVSLNPIDISKHDPAPVAHQGVSYPQFAKGFFHWIHSGKNKTVNFNKFEGKKRVYLVANGYERYVDDYSSSIGMISKEYFDITKGKVNILSRAFYKLWEILYYYDLIDINDASFKSAHLAEGPGSFIQATMFYRDRFSKHSKKDKYHAITIHTESDDSTTPELEKRFIDYYAKEKPIRFSMHKTYSKQVAGGSKNKDNGDLTQTKTIELFKKDIKDKVDLVTGDGGFDWTNENIQEQECALLIYSQILTALNIQKKGGVFVLKMYEMFTDLSLKFIIILKYFYSNVYIVKPLMSRESNSERYIVCKGFKYEEKDIKGLLSKMIDSLDKMGRTGESRTADSDFFADIFPDVEIPLTLARQITSYNISLICSQYKVINKMIEFIDGSNYHGDLYKDYRDRQIELTKYWIEKFFPDIPKKVDAIKDAQDLVAVSEKDDSNHLANMLKSYADYEPKIAISTVTKKPAPKAKAGSKAKSKANMARATLNKNVKRPVIKKAVVKKAPAKKSSVKSRPTPKRSPKKSVKK